MNKIILILFVVILAIIESIIRINLGIYSIEASLILIFSTALYLSGMKKNSTLALIIGSIVLDFFSPYRFGLYLLFGLFTKILMKIFSSRSFDIHHPIVNFAIFIVLVFVYNIFQLASDPILSIFVVSIVLNALIGSIISFTFFHFFKKDQTKMEVSEHVDIR